MQRTLLFLALVVFTSSAEASLKWAQKMQELNKTLTEILPEITSHKPPTAQGLKKLERGAKKLADVSHVIHMGAAKEASVLPPEADPSIRFISDLFERETQHAYRALKAGHVDYAKQVLRMVTGFCIACHTRNDRGPDFPQLTLSPSVAKLSPMERGDLFAATRQFDKALETYEGVVADAKVASGQSLLWSRAFRSALSIAVRVRRDPDAALAVVAKAEKLERVPMFVQPYLAPWRKTLEAWKKEGKRESSSEEQLFSEATRLHEAAREAQKYPLDHSGDLLYLRSSAVLHELLSAYPSGKHTAEALLMAGTSYELIEERSTSLLPEMYYESCVRHSPHSAIAQKCFQRFQEMILFGYTGSAGTSVPEDVQARMDELKELASPK